MFSIVRVGALVLSASCAATLAHAQTERENPAIALWNSLKPAQPPAQERQAQAPGRTRSEESQSRRMADKANDNTVSIIGSNPGGSSLTIAYDLSAVLDKPGGLRVLPVVGKGAIQNIHDVLFLRGIDMGLTGTNSLSYYEEENAEKIPGLRDKLVYITKLYNEEVHIYARPEIKSIQHLEGKRVSFNNAGGGTQYTARQMFKALGVNPVEVNMGPADSVEAMRRNDIVAMVLEAGKPSRAFDQLDRSGGFHFLPVDYAQSLEKDFLPSELTHADYPNLIPEGQTVETVATAGVLVAYNWPVGSERYRRLAAFTEAFFENFAELRKPPRHPKWGEVSLLTDIPGMKRFVPAKEWLDKNTTKKEPVAAGDETQLRSEFDAFLAASSDTKADGETREKLFREFLRWRQESAPK